MTPKTRTHGRSGRSDEALRDLLADSSHPLVAVLDSLHANCFVADLDLTLVWTNRAAQATMVGLAPAVREAFGLDVGQMVGGSIHRFHKDKARIEQILSDPSALPRDAVFSFGGVTLRTLINQVTDGQGTRLGYVVVWDNVSARNASADAAVRAVAAATEQISGISREVVEISGHTSAEADSAAGATEELRAAIAEIARSSNEATGQVRAAVTATETGVARLADLQHASTEIGDFLRLITGVAEQTKMLALNATIEAARAGSAGKGFAVVADEVKQLAGATAASITDIEARIEAIQSAAAAGAATLADIEHLVTTVLDAQTSVAAAIEEQSAVATDLARSITVMSNDASQATSKTNQVADGIQEITQRTTTLHQLIVEA
ncbi:methyl-accepting chemotaxis protein [Cellulomonas citrea]|uniref:methyl-accepting chemotaxis protein n=1 Tax=Cellulomonas citrea TaxID=1909423 RepID=UPI001B356CE0|nr:methyl-accepting chemotaxis protein [Cellulomonas citrea]